MGGGWITAFLDLLGLVGSPRPEPAVRGWAAVGGLRDWGAAGGERVWAGAGGSRAWIAGDDMGQLVRNEITKSPGDAVRLSMDFGDLPELKAGVVVSSCDVVAAAGITATSPATVSDGYLATTRISGGTFDSDYAVIFTAALDDGTIIERVATLQVRR